MREPGLALKLIQEEYEKILITVEAINLRQNVIIQLKRKHIHAK